MNETSEAVIRVCAVSMNLSVGGCDQAIQPQELDRGINFCQISRKSPDTANYRSPCGLLAINNYQHLLSLESSSHFISLSEKLK